MLRYNVFSSCLKGAQTSPAGENRMAGASHEAPIPHSKIQTVLLYAQLVLSSVVIVLFVSGRTNLCAR